MASIQDLFITAAVLADGAVKILYAGLDATKAQAVYAAAGVECAEVGVISHPQVVFPRRPAEEARLEKEAAEAAARRESAEADRLKALATAKEAESTRLAVEAKAIRKGIVVESIAAEKREKSVETEAK
jgi:predicted exporter